MRPSLHSLHQCTADNLLLATVLARMCWPVRQLVAVASDSVLPLLLMNAIETVLFVKVTKVDLEDACLLARPAAEGRCIAGRNWVAHWVVSLGRRVFALSLQSRGSGLQWSSKVRDYACMSVRLL